MTCIVAVKVAPRNPPYTNQGTGQVTASLLKNKSVPFYVLLSNFERSIKEIEGVR